MVREFFNADWIMAIQTSIRDAVERLFRSDLYRWPILQSFEAEIYQATSDVRLFVMRDRGPTNAVPAYSGTPMPWPSDAPSLPDPLRLDALSRTLEDIRRHFNVRPQDAAMLIPETSGMNLDEDWGSQWTAEEKVAYDTQLSQTISRQLHYVRGFDSSDHFTLPPAYEFLSPECARFLNEHPVYERNVFIMTRFVERNDFLGKLDSEIRGVLRDSGFDPVRADDKMYMRDRNLWNNVCVYMLCCSKGVAILEDRVRDEFNPNVALEYGFMRALGKPALLLADSGFRNLRADVIGTLRETFDATDISGTIRKPVQRWLAEL